MNLKEIMAIAGKPGLYKIIAQAKNGIVVENIIDHKRIQAFTSDKISNLEEISIYTESDDMPLREVIKKIYEKLDGKATPDFKGDNIKIKDFFNNVLPEYDKDRVYVSHMQKIISWYNLLLEQNMIDLVDEEVKEEDIENIVQTENSEVLVEETSKKSPGDKKKTPNKKKE